MFQNFTNQYQLSKTLRFELRPVGSDGKPLSQQETAETFAKILEQDQKVKEAYIALKPIMDSLHENIINKSLTSNEARGIYFSEYFEEYKKGKEKKLDSFEENLRILIGKTLEETTNKFAEIAGNDKNDKPIFKKKKGKHVGVEYLTQAGVLKYIENNIKDLVPYEKIKEFIDTQKVTVKTINKKGVSHERKEPRRSGHIEIFGSFFTYFSGYNQNRENYYFTNDNQGKGKSTSVAYRIVDENLPRFCDNILLFEKRKDNYTNALQYLKNNHRTTQIKDALSNTMIEAQSISEEWFEVEKFSEHLGQAGIEEYNKMIGHYNLLINLYNQARKSENDFKKLSPFKTLHKQIGCGTKKALFEEIQSDEKLKSTLLAISDAEKKYFQNSSDENAITIYTLINWLKENEDWNGVYWSKIAVDKISNEYLANWHVIKDRIQAVLQSKDKNQKELKEILKAVASFNKRREESFKLNDAVELSGLFKILDRDDGSKETGWSKFFFKETVLVDKKSLIDEDKTPSQNLIALLCDDIENIAQGFARKSSEVLTITNYKDENNILSIKKWLDANKSVLWLIKSFEVKESKAKGDNINPELSNMLSVLLRTDDADWFGWYDLVRNYLSKKPQDDAKKNKLKLNFGKGNLLDGFVDSHTDNKSRDNATQYGGYIFRKRIEDNEFEYFLGISKNSMLFRCHLQNQISDNDKSELERLEYYQAKSTTYFDDTYSKNKVSLVSVIEDTLEEFCKNDADLKEKAEKIKKRDRNNNITPTTLIDRIRKQDNIMSILENKSVIQIIKQTILDLQLNTQNFITRAPRLREVQNKEYLGADGLKLIIDDLQTIAKENKVFNFFKVRKNEFADSMNDENKPLYLFKISNKDLSFSETSRKKDKYGNPIRNSKGTENLHTLFFRALMREFESCENIDIGKGEIFFRKKAIDYKPKFDNGREKGHHYDDEKKLKDKFTYPIISNKRFTMDKFQLHLSLALNFNPEKKDINEIVNNNFIKADDIQFLGIDRGEKHLVYYSLVNAKGEIIDQNHLDVIGNKDYLQAINDAAAIRRKKQENWQQKGNISNLKDGYISLVVHEIIQKMKDKEGNYKPTFIVMEDLNTGFKRGRQKFEQQVYQKFELALAKKLNYLVDKNAKMDELGSVGKALQLTPPVTNYQDIEGKKQVGIMLYTRANYTSITDPATGWRKTIYLKKGSEADVKKQILENFDDIGVESGDYFFQYTNASNKVWKLWSGKDGKSLERYRSRRGKDKNEFIIESIDIQELLDKLFEKFDKSKSIKQQLEDGIKLTKIDEHTAWESLRFTIDTILQIRNSGDTKKSQDDNFLLSPVRNEKGEHFDSRKSDGTLPKDADANGAYNIARKGIVMYEHIKQSDKNNLDLFISDREWDLWLTDKQSWRNELATFASKKQKK